MPHHLPEFQGFDPGKPVRIYRRNLPHLRQVGATYFVTFRLVDSVPMAKLEQWKTERENWFHAHGLRDDLPHGEWQKRYREIPETARAAFERHCGRQLLTELDAGHGRCLLRQDKAAKLIENALRFFDGERCRCGDFCVMPNHVHWLTLPLPGYELEDIMHSIKSYTATQINTVLGTSGSVWQHESYDRLVRNASELLRTRDYIRNNPKNTKLPPHKEHTWQCAWLDTVQSIKLDA